MAKQITVVTLGAPAQTKDFDATTVGELAEELTLSDNLQVKVNGETKDYSAALSDYNHVVFGEKIKGGSVATLIQDQEDSVLDCIVASHLDSYGLLQIGMM